MKRLELFRNRLAYSKAPSLCEGYAVLHVISTMRLSDSLLCVVDHFAFWAYGYRYHYSTTFRGMFMDTTRSPDLQYMAFLTCCRHDTGEAEESLLLFSFSSVSAFIQTTRIRPSLCEGYAVLHVISTMRLSDEGYEVILSAKSQAAAKANEIQHR